MSIGLSSFLRLCKNIGVIGGGITGTGLIGLIVWVLFAQSKVESCIDKKWICKNGVFYHKGLPEWPGSAALALRKKQGIT